MFVMVEKERRLLDWYLPQIRERRSRAIAYKSRGLFKKRRVISCTLVGSSLCQRGEGTQGRVRRRTPPEGEGRTHPGAPHSPDT